MNGSSTAQLTEQPSASPATWHWTHTLPPGLDSLQLKPLHSLLPKRKGSIQKHLMLLLARSAPALCPNKGRFSSSCFTAATLQRGLNLPSREQKIFSFPETCLKCVFCVFLV